MRSPGISPRSARASPRPPPPSRSVGCAEAADGCSCPKRLLPLAIRSRPGGRTDVELRCVRCIPSARFSSVATSPTTVACWSSGTHSIPRAVAPPTTGRGGPRHDCRASWRRSTPPRVLHARAARRPRQPPRRPGPHAGRDAPTRGSALGCGPQAEDAWRSDVLGALEVLDEATTDEERNAALPESLLSDIARTQPRLRNRVRGLRIQYRQLRDTIAFVRRELQAPDVDVEVADVRQRLASLLGALRHQRGRESDLIYEAYYEAFHRDLWTTPEASGDTLIYYVIGDNGASAEGGVHGCFNEVAALNGAGFLETTEFMVSRIDHFGTPKAFNHYAVGWAHAVCTPYQWTEQVASYWGGTRNGTVVHWPNGIAAKGELRHQFSHVIDVAPTVLEAAGLPEPTFVNGVQQIPYEGASMRFAFDDADAPGRHETQYFEMFCNRGIYRPQRLDRRDPPQQPMAGDGPATGLRRRRVGALRRHRLDAGPRPLRRTPRTPRPAATVVAARGVQVQRAAARRPARRTVQLRLGRAPHPRYAARSSCCSPAWGGSARARCSTSRTSPTALPPRSPCPTAEATA